MLRNNLRLLLNNYLHSSPTLSSKIIIHILKNKQKGKRVFIHEITWLIIMKMKMKMKNRSHRYDIDRPWPRHGHKYTKYKECLSMMMFTCIKQQLSNIWSSIPVKVKQHWSWDEKNVACKKKPVGSCRQHGFFYFVEVSVSVDCFCALP